MSVSLVGWGRFFDKDGNRITVPAPSTDPGARWLWDVLAAEAAALARAGFDRIQLPPVSKAQGGAGAGCDGYGLYDPRDLGTKLQQGSVPTRYGTAEQLRRLVGIAHANGLGIDFDLVLHQLIGGNSGSYRYLGADGTTLNGRGSMSPGCFRAQPGAGTQPEDDVPAPRDDQAFGDEKVYQHADPTRYTIEDALDYGDWLFRTTDADGGRIDDVKGLWAPFVAEFLNHGAMAERPFWAEYFDSSLPAIDGWATGAPLHGRCCVADFPLHFALQAACNGLDASALSGSGYAEWNPGLAHVFVENPDTDTSPGQQIIGSKMLAYAYVLTIACREVHVYGKDYFPGSVWPGAYGLQPLIDNLVYINRTFAYGRQITRWVDGRVIAIERDGQGGAIGTSPGLLTALNFDTYNQRAITCATSFGSNVQLHDYTGHHGDIWTDGYGNATFTIPANAYGGGQSYLCFSRAGADKPIRIDSRRTTQVFFGAVDLDTPPAGAGAALSAGRIYVAEGSVVDLVPSAGVETVLLDSATAVAVSKAPRTGWYEVAVHATHGSDIPFEVSATYLSPEALN
jgi:alpha-amylase